VATARAETRSISRLTTVSAGPALFAAWLIGALLITVIRPGQLLEFATIGVAGAIAWRAILRGLKWVDLMVGAACFLVPLLNTWPLRIYQSLADRLPTPLPALLSASSLVAIALLFGVGLPRWQSLSRLTVVAASVLAIGGLAAALLSGNVGVSISAWWSGVLVPITIAAAVTGRLYSWNDGWRVVALLALGALVPLTVAVAAYLLSFGVPRSGDDLAVAKVLLFRPHLIQESTFGNIGHLADFAILVMPAALVGAARLRFPRLVRVALLVAGAGSLIVLTITVSRSALLFGALVALALVIQLTLQRDLRSASLPLVACAVLLAVSLSPPIRSSLTELIPRVMIASPLPAASATPQPGVADGSNPLGGEQSTTVGPIMVTTGEQSEIERIDAVRTGVTVFAQRMPFGVGPGQYETYDPTHTASHSLFVEMLAEEGVLGAVAFLLLFILIIRQALSLSLSRTRADHLRLATLAGAGGFLLHGAFAGAPLAFGVVDTWAILFWIQIGIAGATNIAEAPR